MCRRFPQLKLCEHNWKAEQIATEYYPSWYTNHHKDAAIKQELDDTKTRLTKRTRDPTIMVSDGAEQPVETALQPAVVSQSAKVNTRFDQILY